MDGYDKELDAARGTDLRGEIFTILFVIFGVAAAILLL